MSRPAPRQISSALERLTASLAPATTLARVQGVWESVAGSAIAAEARPSSEHNGVLTVSCSAAVWAQELDLMGPVLISRLNAALGDEALSGLRCRTR